MYNTHHGTQIKYPVVYTHTSLHDESSTPFNNCLLPWFLTGRYAEAEANLTQALSLPPEFTDARPGSGQERHYLRASVQH